jgi:sarcosine oxidase, subunit beta
MRALLGDRRRGERVVLIGGGITAALSAVRLAERGFQVLVLEKASLGNGSSSRSMAGIRAQFGLEATIVGMLYSEWWYRHFHDLLQTPADRRQPVIRQNGYLFLYDQPFRRQTSSPPNQEHRAAQAWLQAQRQIALQRQLGVDVELLAPDEISHRWRHLEVEQLVGATFCQHDGFLFPVVIYGEAFRRAAELGAEIMQQTEVLGAEQRGGRIVSLQTSRGPVESDWVVNCTNAWAPRTSQRLGGLPLPIEPVKRFLYLLRPERPLLAAEAWDQLPMTIYGMGTALGAHTRPEGPNLLLAGTNQTWSEPDFADEDQDRVPPAFDHRSGIENFGLQLLLELSRYSPALANSGGLVATTCGYYGMTPDRNPLIGLDPLLANLVHAAGFSGHGVMHAPVTAFLVETILTSSAPGGIARLPEPFTDRQIDLRAFDPNRDFDASSHESAVL